jgi:hypothetical protein
MNQVEDWFKANNDLKDNVKELINCEEILKMYN